MFENINLTPKFTIYKQSSQLILLHSESVEIPDKFGWH